MKFTRIRRVMIILLSSLAVVIVLAAVRSPQLAELAKHVGRRMAIQLALATAPSHDPRHQTASLASWAVLADRALGER